LTVFRDFCLKARTLPRFKFYRSNANFSYKREPYRTKTLTVLRDFNIKNLNLMNLLEKREPYREAFLYEKALKTDICAVRFALTALFSFKK
jgi:hypothetical protein